jgi:monofunctional biosynthetic peptidoglycan transglycosylase
MLKTCFVVLFFGFVGVLVAVVAIYLGAKTTLTPAAGEWAVPLRLGSTKAHLQFQASVPALLRLASAPWVSKRVGPWVHGRSVQTGAGPVRMIWLASTQTLVLHCEPCTLHSTSLGSEPLQLQALQVSVRLNGGPSGGQNDGPLELGGELSSGQVHADWHGTLTGGGMRLQLQLPATPIADVYALFSPNIAEVSQAHIEGRISLRATLDLPGGSLSVAPLIEGFQVSGLGTEALANAHSACSPDSSRLASESWLARAVLAAEDQRFYQHMGYDITELTAALAINQQVKGTQRGASTLSQQLAKLLVTGGERSPVRKLRELLYAVEIEQTLGKNRILRLYLAHAPWGQGICGAEAASRYYFSRPAHELSPTQAAWLAAMLHNPGLEAERWASTGQINIARTQWVLLGMRPMARSQRVRLAELVGAPLLQRPARQH